MKAIVSLSGGADSATTLALALKAGREVESFGFYYASKHNPWENQAAENLAAHYGIPFQLIDISGIMGNFKSSLLASGEKIPEGHYQEENMRSTVVPMRNIIFASILAGIADSKGAEEIWLGVHAGDHFIYPDCRKETIEAMNKVIYLATEKLIEIRTPLQGWDKTKIINEGFVLGVPYELTRTCYTAGEIACGKCGSCQERLEAFRNLGLTDPIPYQR